MALEGYLPKTEGGRVTWLNTFAGKVSEAGSTLPTKGEELGLTAAEVAGVLADNAMYGFCIGNQDNFKDEKEARTKYKNRAATGAEGVVMEPYPVVTPVTPPTAVPQGIFKRIPLLVARIKANQNYNTTVGEAFGIIGDEDTFDRDTFKPGLKVTNTQQGRLVEFVKDQTDGVNVNSREVGQTVWTLLGRDNFSPYLDSRIFARPTKMEYMVTAVIGDEEIGLDSDHVEIITE